MNISYNWLKDLIDIDLSADEVATQLTRVGVTVEGVHQQGNDHVLDIDLTSNRSDCLSHLGVARELSAITGKPVKIAQPTEDDEPEIPLPAVLAYDVLAIQNPDLCHRFTARIIKNVKIGPSPQWLVERLEAIGERAINNIAEVFADPQVNHRGMVTQWEHPLQPSLRLVSSPMKLSETPVRMEMPPPLLGQHTEQVLRELLACSDDRLAQLRNGKVI